MKSSLLSFIIVISFSIPIYSLDNPLDFRNSACDNQIGNSYTNTSTFASNFKTLLSNIIPQHNVNKLFYNLTIRNNNSDDVDSVNGIAFCRGDLSFSDCKACISNATIKIQQICPNQKAAIVWYNGCMLSYSNNSILHSLDVSFKVRIVSSDNASDADTYDRQLGTLLRRLQNKAAGGDYRRKYASGSESVGNFGIVYALVECTPDLLVSDCVRCLQSLMDYIPKGNREAFLMSPSCDIRFDNNLFYNLDVESLSPAPSPSSSDGTGSDNTTTTGKVKKGSKGRVIGIVVPSVICVVLLALVLSWCFFTRRKNHETVESYASVNDTQDDIKSIESLQYDFSIIRTATNNFSDENKLGQGGFGAVYKGIIHNGQKVAVKRLAKNSRQGEEEFKNEVLLLAKLQHRNLVRLLGFCLEREERLLVYEYVPNASLDKFLFDPVKQGILDDHIRYKIITGIARGMLYLHEDSRLRIIHRDLKASNILLDEEMNPKISDFGTARLFQMDQSQGDTKRIVGTYGYMAPEYALHGLFSVKSDVYSFGVLVLEMISGRRSFGLNQEEDSDHLISNVWKNWREGTAMNIVDNTLKSGRWRNEIMRCIHIGLLCVQENAVDRPTMSEAVIMLSSHSFTLPLPTHPAFITRSLSPMNEHI